MQSRPSRIDVALARALLLQVIARADAGQAGADDQDVEMFCVSVMAISLLSM